MGTVALELCRSAMVAMEPQQQWRGAGLEREQEKEGEGRDREWRGQGAGPLLEQAEASWRPCKQRRQASATCGLHLCTVSALFINFKFPILPQTYH